MVVTFLTCVSTEGAPLPWLLLCVPGGSIASRLPRFVVTMTRSRSPTLFRKAFHIKGNDELRWVTQTHAFQVF